MWKKQDERKEEVKDEAYYVMIVEKLRELSKNLLIVAKNIIKEDGTCQIWSSGSAYKGIFYPTNGLRMRSTMVIILWRRSCSMSFWRKAKMRMKR